MPFTRTDSDSRSILRCPGGPVERDGQVIEVPGPWLYPIYVTSVTPNWAAGSPRTGASAGTWET